MFTNGGSFSTHSKRLVDLEDRVTRTVSHAFWESIGKSEAPHGDIDSEFTGPFVDTPVFIQNMLPDVVLSEKVMGVEIKSGL